MYNPSYTVFIIYIMYLLLIDLEKKHIENIRKVFGNLKSIFSFI